MRAILAICVGIGMVVAGLRLPPDLEEMPLFMAVPFVLFGALLIYGGFYHGWLRFQRHRAYSGGRERSGTTRLLRPISDDSGIAYLMFATRNDEWMLSVDSASIRNVRGDLDEGVPSRAYLGDDDRVYGLDIGDVKALPISVGMPYKGKLRDRVKWAERKKREWSENAVRNEY